MFDYLCGKVQLAGNNAVVIDVAGVGFLVQVPTSTQSQLQQQKQAMLYVKLVVREDNLRLFGFTTKPERDMFEKLQTISGIGPGLALNILSAGKLDDLRQAIIAGDLQRFKKIKGVGQKMANRIVLELKGSLPPLEPTPAASADESIAQAVSALIGLGYPRQDALEAVNKVLDKLPQPRTVEDIVIKALQNI